MNAVIVTPRLPQTLNMLMRRAAIALERSPCCVAVLCFLPQLMDSVEPGVQELLEFK